MGLRVADVYGGTTARGAGSMSDTEAASGANMTAIGGVFPTIWVVGIVLAFVLLRVAYEMAG